MAPESSVTASGSTSSKQPLTVISERRCSVRFKNAATLVTRRAPWRELSGRKTEQSARTWISSGSRVGTRSAPLYLQIKLSYGSQGKARSPNSQLNTPRRAVRAGSNLSNFCKKSSSSPKRDRWVVTNSKSAVTEGDLTRVAHALNGLRKLRLRCASSDSVSCFTTGMEALLRGF